MNCAVSKSAEPVRAVDRKEIPMGVKAVLVGLVGVWCWHLNQSAWAGVLLYEPFAYPTGQQLSLTGTGDPLTLPSPTTTQWDGGLGFASAANGASDVQTQQSAWPA